MESNSIFLGTVSMFNSNKAVEDKNGLMPMIIEPIAGSCPHKRVLAGTVAQNMNLEDGATYLFKWTKLEDDEEYGTQYGFTKLSTPIVDVIQIIKATTSLGAVKKIGEE